MDRVARYPVNDDQVMTVPEFADLARVSEQTVYRWIRDGVPTPIGPVRLAVVRSPCSRLVGRDVHTFTDCLAKAFGGDGMRSAQGTQAMKASSAREGRRQRAEARAPARVAHGPLERTPKALIGTYPDPGEPESLVADALDRGDVASA